MEVVYRHCAGLDVHKKTVVACRVTRDPAGQRVSETRTFGTMTSTLQEMSDWLGEGDVTHVAMESTGSYWRPVYNMLEGRFTLLLVNPAHIKNVPGRKTDVKDAEWIAQLLEVGLLKGSFVPEPEQRDLRDLTRERANLVRERANVVNRIQKILETANIKLGSVASNVCGVSGTAMLQAIVHGEDDPNVLASLAKGRLRSTDEELRQALVGRLRPHHLILLSVLLEQVEGFDAGIRKLSDAIEEFERPFEPAVQLLDTIPGIGRPLAETILSEIGTDMSRFPTAAHLSAWAGVAPGNNQSAGRVLSSRSRKGCPALKKALVQAAHSAARKADTYLSAQYHRLAARRGKKRAIMAVAHTILVDIYYMLKRQEPYQEHGGDYFDTRKPDALFKRLNRHAANIGYTLTPLAPPPSPTPGGFS